MKKFLVSLLLIVLCAGCSSSGGRGDLTVAAPAESNLVADSATPKHFTYLTGDEKAWSSFSPKPDLGSAVDQADLMITLTAQAQRTDAQMNEALLDKEYTIKLETSVIDPDFDIKYSHTYQVLAAADDDGYLISKVIKETNGRLRPFVQHPILVHPLFAETNFSYPSGHATGTELQARILGTLFPAQADALLNRARQVADSRVVAGVHYASDTEAGLALGDLLFAELEATDKFKTDLSTAAKMDNIATK